jgi:hypothetical protein
VYVPHEPEDAAGRATFANVNAPYAIKIRATVSNYPPEWATDYVFVEQEAPIPSIARRTARNIDTDPNYPSLYRISLCKPYHSGSIIHKEIKENDLLTFISNGVTFDTTVGYNVPLTYCESLIQIPIVRYSTNEGYEGLECVYIPKINLESFSGPLQNFVIDIQTINKESNSYVYREISPIFRVSAPHTINRAHRGNVQDQTSLLPAIVDLTNYGDTWLRPRAMLTNYTGYMDRIIMWTKDPHYSDYYLSEWSDKGRYQIFNPNNRRLEQNSDLLHSEAFSNDTLINGLSSFQALNRAKLQPSHGRILALINKGGSVLTVIQAKKETSIYIQQTFGLGGDSNVPAFTDKIFGHLNPLKDNYGSMHKGSVALTEMGLVYWDQLNACFVLSAGDGQRNISSGDNGEMKFVNFSQNLATIIQEAIGTEKPLNLASFYDQDNKEYVCSIRVGALTADASTILVPVLSLNQRRWKRVDDYEMVFGANFGNFCFSCTVPTVLDGQAMYKHNKGAITEFYGEYRHFQADAIFADPGTTMKEFKNINIITDAGLNIIHCPEIEVPYTQDQNSPMSSLLYKENFEAIDGKLSAKFLGDVNGPFPTEFGANLNYKLSQGQALRGYAIRVKIQHRATEKVTIGAILVSWLPIKPL